MNLGYFDTALLVILLLFLLRGVMNGFLREFSGLLGLCGGIWYARQAYRDVTPWLDFIESAVRRDLVAYGVIFLSVLLAVGLFVHLLSKAFSLSILPPLDKMLGAVLGVVRGLAICAVSLVILRHFAPDLDFFRASPLTPWLQPFLNFARLYLPASLV